MRISILSLTNKKYGGTRYLDMVKKCLSHSFEIEHLYLNAGLRNETKIIRFLRAVKSLISSRFRTDFDISICDFETSLFLNSPPIQNIVILHHIDLNHKSKILNILHALSEWNLRKRKNRVYKIVVVSKFWKDYLTIRGIMNVIAIYSAFDLKEFDIEQEETLNFKNKYHLNKKLILYIGNAQLNKGYQQAYEKLKDLDVHLVSSGIHNVNPTTLHLNLSYKEYLLLLKASTAAIFMSQFDEGWCRSAHEALLCKTPVIGSGRGGMGELLTEGKQIILSDISLLKEEVKYLLNHPEIRIKMGEEGYNFAKTFSIDKFEKEWLQLIKEIQTCQK